MPITIDTITFDDMPPGFAAFKNQPAEKSPGNPPAVTTGKSAPIGYSITEFIELREQRQVTATRDGMTGSRAFIQKPTSSAATYTCPLPEVNQRWSLYPNEAEYELYAVSVKRTPYAKDPNGSEIELYTVEYSSQPLDPIEIDLGGDFVSVKPGATSGFYWADTEGDSTGEKINQTLNRVTLSGKIRVTKRRAAYPINFIASKLGCVNSDDVTIPGMSTIPGTDAGASPDTAHLLFEGSKAVETTNPNGGRMWRVTYNFAFKYNVDTVPRSGVTSGWNNIMRDSTGLFTLTYPPLFKQATLSKLIADDDEGGLGT